jgi:hypothetical protein
MKASRPVNRVRENAAAYGAVTAEIVVMPWSTLDAGERWMRDLKETARKVSRALQEAGVPHAVIGGLAVAAHVARVDSSAERNTKDLDLLLERSDLDAATRALLALGLRYREVMGIPAFVSPGGKGLQHRFREGVHVVWAGEKVRPDYPVPAPSLAEAPVVRSLDGYACLGVEQLLRMKLTSFRLKDQVHVQDLMELKLITKKMKESLPSELRVRLRQVEEATERERLG